MHNISSPACARKPLLELYPCRIIDPSNVQFRAAGNTYRPLISLNSECMLNRDINIPPRFRTDSITVNI
jgi:hypothetical protein